MKKKFASFKTFVEDHQNPIIGATIIALSVIVVAETAALVSQDKAKNEQDSCDIS